MTLTGKCKEEFEKWCIKEFGLKDELNIDLKITESTHVGIQLYDISGKIISIIEDADFEIGSYSIHYQEIKELTNGIYFIEFNIGSDRIVEKLVKH